MSVSSDARHARVRLARAALDHHVGEHLAELARRLGQALPDVMVEGGPGEANPGMPGVGGH